MSVPFEKYDALVQLVAQMKREGFTMPSTQPDRVLMPELPKVVRQAIADLYEPQSANYRHALNQAWEMVNLGVEEGEVVKRIQAGEPVEL